MFPLLRPHTGPWVLGILNCTLHSETKLDSQSENQPQTQTLVERLEMIHSILRYKCTTLNSSVLISCFLETKSYDFGSIRLCILINSLIFLWKQIIK